MLSGTNAYTGATTLAGGTLTVGTLANTGSNSSIGNFATAGATGLVLSGGTFNYTGGSVTTNRGFTVNGVNARSTISVGAGVALNLGASVKNESQTVNTNGLAFSAAGAGSGITISSLTITALSNPDFNLVGSFNPNVTIQNLNVSGANIIHERTGNYVLNVGNINGTGASGWFGGMNISGVISGYTGAIVLGGNTTFTGLSTFDTTVTAQQGGIYSFNTIKNVGGGASALGAPATTANGTIGFGNGGNTPTLRYTGTWTLSGANTYTGTTSVNGGTLLINGSTSSTSGVTVGASGTLGGNGVVGGATTVNGNLRPGTSPGLLEFGTLLTLGGTATTTMEIDGLTRETQHDGVNVVGLLTYGGALVFDFGTTFGSSQTWNLFDSGSGIRASEADKRIRWFMNSDFRLALLRDDKEVGKELVIDFTRYDLPAKESADTEPGKNSRNWSLMNRINQKGIRPQDRPVALSELTDEEQAMIRRRYPELFAPK